MEDNFDLPRLSPFLKLHQAQQDEDGTPSWLIHDPLSDKYFKIGWHEFECIARLHRHKTAQDLVQDIHTNTSLDISLEDVKEIILFLQQNKLLQGPSEQAYQPAKKIPFIIKLVKNYLFFSVPLLRPEKLLDILEPLSRPFFSRPFIIFSMLLLAGGLIATLLRAEEFLNTFFNLFSLQGLLITAGLFTLIKITHEFGHALTARRYGVDVPHMGVAFIVMYPILYTETTGAWKLTSKRKRLHIGLAGITTELILAAYFLLLWHLLPTGSPGQTIAFAVVTISLIGSLFVNLNPFMRFDGYYVLSDLMGIENLHARAIEMARWRLRQFLWGLPDEPPEEFEPDRKRFMIWFGFAVLIYRFFLFLGIAFLVYHIFFKPLGLILMLIELAWFIGLPILKELKIWGQRRKDIFKQRRTILTTICIGAFIALGFIPWHGSVQIDAIKHPENYRAFYASDSVQILRFSYENGQRVQKDDILIELKSDQLEKKIRLAEIEIAKLEQEKRQAQSLRFENTRYLAAEMAKKIEAAQEQLKLLHDQKKNLIITAPFSGIINAIDPALHEGRFIEKGSALFSIMDSSNIRYTGFLNERSRERLNKGQIESIFIPDSHLYKHTVVNLNSRDFIPVKKLEWQELASIYNGPIPSDFGTDQGKNHDIIPRNAVFSAIFDTEQGEMTGNKPYLLVQTGKIRIKTTKKSFASQFFTSLTTLLIQEIYLN